MGMKFAKQVLRRSNQEEVDNSRQDEEVDYCRDKRAILHLAAVDIRNQVIEIGFADKCAEQRIDNVGGQRTDDAGKGGADNHRDGQVHYIAAQDEVTESFEHANPP